MKSFFKKLIIENKNQPIQTNPVSWGHWFTFFNMLICFLIGSQYLVVSDWPSTFTGRFYAILSCIGQFSLLAIIVYLFTLFLVTLFIKNSLWLRFIGATIATFFIFLLLFDLVVYYHFRLHLNELVLRILLSPSGLNLLPAWYTTLAFVVCLFLLEFLLATFLWSFQRRFANQKWLIIASITICIFSFVVSNIMHMWADANFYRPITMQTNALPLSRPLTAKTFWQKHGFKVEKKTSETLLNSRDSFALAAQYPLSKLSYQDNIDLYNILIIDIDAVDLKNLDKNMPKLTKLAQNSVQLQNHFTTNIQNDLSVFSLFYGLTPNYYNAILLERRNSVLFEPLEKNHYNLGFFSTFGFSSLFYQRALLSNFTFGNSEQEKTNLDTINDWNNWFNRQKNGSPWFSYIELNGFSRGDYQSEYLEKIEKIDQLIARVFSELKRKKQLDETVIVITSNQGLNFSRNKNISWNIDHDFSIDKLRVPMFIFWPNQKPRVVEQLTSHIDLLPTLMIDLFKTKTDLNKFSLGNNLFELDRKKSKNIIAGNSEFMFIISYDRIIMLDKLNHYRIYDYNYTRLDNNELDIPLLLQILTQNRRFVTR